jgi:hypothetical protein
MNKSEALKLIIESAEYYKLNYENRKLLLVCSNNSLKKITVMECAFDRTNFMHLTGVKFREGYRMPPDVFFDSVIGRHLSFEAFELASDGTTEMKLRVLPSILKSKSLSANMSGDYNLRKPVLVTEKLAGGVRGCVGFIYDDSLKCYIPNTVLNEDIRLNIKNQQRVILAYRKNIPNERYEERVYSAKKIDWGKVELPQGYEYLSLPEIELKFEMLDKNNAGKRIGVAKGEFDVPDNIDECNGEISDMFGVNG